MSNARNLADIVTGNFDVPLGALDNVPPSNDASALTTGTLADARLPSNIGGFKSFQSFVGSYATGGTYTWTRPAGITKVRVYVIGGGGGGYSVSSNSQASGGAGGLSIAMVDVTNISSVTVTLGNGGTGSNSGSTRGGTAGTSSFGSYVTATGGYGGISGLPPYDGGQGGVGTTAVGGAVLSALNITGNGGHRSGGANSHPNGGSSFFGGGGIGAHTDSNILSQQHGQFGGGAGCSQYSHVINGGAGVVYVEEYA